MVTHTCHEAPRKHATVRISVNYDLVYFEMNKCLCKLGKWLAVFKGGGASRMSGSYLVNVYQLLFTARKQCMMSTVHPVEYRHDLKKCIES